MIQYRTALVATFLIAIAFLSGCSSTGNPDHPIRLHSWHEIVFGHTKYTPEEKVFARCRYWNKNPDGSHTGFQRECRLEAAQYPMGVNAAMFAAMCVIDKCHKLADDWRK